jgi:RNA-directed DNA polymerase
MGWISSKRVRDGVLLRLIGKWLNAGVMEDGALEYPEAGTPQGGVISPLLANIYLHEVLDEWFALQVAPRLGGRAVLVRYADDVVIIFEQEQDARRVIDVLPKRLAKYGLTLHPDKTRLVDFRRPDRRDSALSDNGEARSRTGTFDLLGFTHYWAMSRKGYWVVKQKTAADRSGASSSASRIGVGVTAMNRFENNGQHSRGSCWGISGTSPSSAT